MIPSEPVQGGPGQRTLAAIVFSDAVNFSARMTEDEPAALKAVRRDLAMMSEVCARYDGRVVKNTGDGLMMLFSSAVQAVHCAIEIQRVIAEAARIQPSTESFVHRIGVHLGDVVLTTDDAFGDGINIAARLQEHAEPGGVCMSQTVFDVVRSSLAVPVDGPQRLALKNVETVDALRIGPLAITGQRVRQPRGRTSGTQGYAWVTVGILILAGAILYTGYSLKGQLNRAPSAAPAPPADATRTGASAPPAPAAAPSALPASQPSEERNDRGATVPRGAPPSNAAPASRTVTGPKPDGKEIEERKRQARNTYEYGAFVRWVGSHPSLRDDPGVQESVRRYQILEQGMGLAKSALAAASPASPITMRTDTGRGTVTMSAWGADGRVVLVGPRGPRTSSWSELTPWEVARLVEAATRTATLTPQETQRRLVWINTFRTEYNLAPARGRRGSAG
jgi:class 3 adenylate cyclase